MEVSGDFKVEMGTEEIKVLITSSNFNNHCLPPPAPRKLKDVRNKFFYFLYTVTKGKSDSSVSQQGGGKIRHW